MLREDLLALLVRGLLLLSLALLMVPIERLSEPHRQRRARPGRLTDLLHFFMNPIGVRQALALAFIGLELVLGATVPESTRVFFSTFPFAAQLVCVLLIGELFTYWAHRLSHSWSFLWRFHAVHHSSEDVDWLSAHRQHPFDTLLFVVAANVPAIALGFHGPLVAFVAVFHRAFVTFTHVKVRWGLRLLSGVIVTPRYHHHHHDLDAPPSNFAGLFPFFDLLFGTFHWPERLPTRYGIDHVLPNGWLAQLVTPLIRAPESPHARLRTSGASSRLEDCSPVGGG